MAAIHPVPGKDGNKYIPFEERTGESSVVFFTRDLSAEGLKKIYDKVASVLCGKVVNIVELIVIIEYPFHLTIVSDISPDII